MSATPVIWTIHYHHHHGSISLGIQLHFLVLVLLLLFFNTIFGRNITLLGSLLNRTNESVSHLTKTIKSMLSEVLQWQ